MRVVISDLPPEFPEEPTSEGEATEEFDVTDEDGNDSIAVRHIIRLSVGYDHRIIDGADADQFMVAVREYLENFNEDIG